MLQYIVLAVIGLAALIIGIVLIARRKKAVGIILTVIGALAFIAGVFLTVCAFLLVDFIHNQPPKEPPVTEITQEETPITETQEAEETGDDTIREIGGDTGNDWRTWRSYSGDYKISDSLTVCVSLFDDCTGYAVYDSTDGTRIASLVNDTEDDIDLWQISVGDINGDGVNELGMVLTDGETLWFAYSDSGIWSENNTAGCFERTDR